MVDRKLDAWIAENVFSFTIIYGPNSKYGDYILSEGSMQDRIKLPHYTFNMESAMSVLEALNRDYVDGETYCVLTCYFDRDGNTRWEVIKVQDIGDLEGPLIDSISDSDSPSMAICRAIYRAITEKDWAQA